MKPESLREKTMAVVRWFEQHYDELGCSADEVRDFGDYVRRELKRDIEKLEPRRALMGLLERPRRYQLLCNRDAPAVVVNDERRRIRSVPPWILAAHEQRRLLDGSRSSLFEDRSERRCEFGSLSFRYRSYWDGVEPANNSDETSLESGWTTVDFAARYLEALQQPAWAELWQQQRSLIARHSCADFALSDLADDAGPEDLLRRKNELEARGDLWDGMLETPFIVGRLARLLGPPPEAWGGGSYALVGELRESVFSVVATESQGHGIRHMMGIVGRQGEEVVAEALAAFVEGLVGDQELADTSNTCFHFDQVYAMGVRDARLFYELQSELPYWIEAYWRYGG